MESALATATRRLIEYPDDISGCSSVLLEGRSLLYLCSHEDGMTPFVVVLGYLQGQKQDVITKDLIEPVSVEGRRKATDAVSKNLAPEFSRAHVYFL
jgi:hypothetical protein